MHINRKSSRSNPLQLINKLGKVARYKINIQKSVAFLYTNNEISERKIKETIMFTITSAFYAVVLGCQMWRQSSQREIHKPHFPHLDLKTAPKLQDIKPTTLRASPGMLGTTLKNHL